MMKENKSRVFVDLPDSERNLLQALCDQDYRPTAETIRFLIVAEATKRGLQSMQINSDASGISLQASTGISR